MEGRKRIAESGESRATHIDLQPKILSWKWHLREIEKAAPSPTEVFSPAARKIRSQRPPRKTSVLFSCLSLFSFQEIHFFTRENSIWSFHSSSGGLLSLYLAIEQKEFATFLRQSCFRGVRKLQERRERQAISFLKSVLVFGRPVLPGGKGHSSLLRDASMYYIRGGLRAHWFYLLFFVGDKGSLNPR